MSLLSLTKADGPECPACGCQESDVIDAGTRWGQPITRRRCGACGLAWRAAVPRAAAPQKPAKPAAAKRTRTQ
jgi:uncharacterized Zn finger protein